MPIALRRFTVDELDQFPDDGNRYELLDGVLFVSPAPGMLHGIIVARLVALLETFLASEPETFVAAPGVVAVAPHMRMEPDVLVGTVKPEAALRWENVVACWLAIEVSGLLSRIHDREYKRDAYLDAGVEEVWRIDLEERRAYVRRLARAESEPLETIVWRSPLTGRELVVDVAALFRGIPAE